MGSSPGSLGQVSLEIGQPVVGHYLSPSAKSTITSRSRESSVVSTISQTGTYALSRRVRNQISRWAIAVESREGVQ